MANFSIDYNSVANKVDKLDDVANAISNVEKMLVAIKEDLPMSGGSFVEMKNKIDGLANSTHKHQLKLKELSVTLDQIVKLYEKADNNIISGASKFQHTIEEIKKKFDDVLYIIGRLSAGMGDDRSCYDGDPVNMCTGNYVDSITEISFGKHMDLQFTRNYNSIFRTVGCMGPGWSHNYEIFLEVYPDKLILNTGDGASEEYTGINVNTYVSKFGSYRKIEKIENTLVLASSTSCKLVFDLTGVLRSVNDSNNNYIQFEYANKKLVKAFDNYNNFIIYEYNDMGNLASVNDSADRRVTFEYENGLLTKCTDVDDACIEYTYDDKARMVSWINPYGIKIIDIIYDEKNRVVKQILADGATMHYEYHNHEVIYTAPNGVKKIYVHDERNRHVETRQKNAVSHYKYNEKNERIEYIDEVGNIHRREFDEEGNIIGYTSPMNEKTTFEFLNGEIVSIVNPDGTITKREYDDFGNVTKYIDECGIETHMEYDSHGNIKAIISEDGSKTQYEYDEFGNVKALIDQEGNRSVFEYDKAGRVVRAVDPRGAETLYTYTPSNNLLSITNANKNTRVYEYTKTRKLCHVKDFDGTEESITYDILDREELYIDKFGRKTKKTYDIMSNVIKLEHPDGVVVTLKYDDLNRVIEESLSTGLCVTYKRNSAGNIIEKNEDGKVTLYTYDKANRIEKIVGENNKVLRLEYNARGQVVRGYENDELKYLYTYDQNNRMTEREVVGKGKERYEYSSTNHLSKIIDVNGAEKTYEYYKNGALRKIEFGDGRELNYKYDANGNIIQKDNGHGYIQSFTYDILNRKTGMSDSEGKNIRYTLDANGKVISRIDSNNNETKYEYSITGKMISAKQNGGDTIRYIYDEKDRLIKIYSGDESDVFSFGRNSNGQVLSVLDAMGNEAKYQYFESGELESITTETGDKIRYLYDEDGQLNSISRGDSIDTNILYTDGKISRIINNYTDVNFEYSSDRLDSVVDTFGNRISYKWTNDGKCEDVIYPNNMSVHTEYDKNSKITKIAYGTDEINFKYNKEGFIEKKIYPNLTEMRYTYYPSGKYKTLSCCDKDNTVLYCNSYEYDGVGNIIKLTEDSISGTTCYEYKYDGNNRILSVNKNGNVQTTFVYDNFGNRTRKISTEAETRYTYNVLNQLVREEKICDEKSEITTYKYNQSGCLVEKSHGEYVLSYVYDFNNRIVKLCDNKGLEKEYIRDAFGNCVETRVNDNGNESVVKYIIDYSRKKDNIIAKVVNNKTSYYVWSSGLCILDQEDQIEYCSCDERETVRTYTDWSYVKI